MAWAREGSRFLMRNNCKDLVVLEHEWTKLIFSNIEIFGILQDEQDTATYLVIHSI